MVYVWYGVWYSGMVRKFKINYLLLLLLEVFLLSPDIVQRYQWRYQGTT